MLGSGNLGLVYLMEDKRRLTLEEIDERHPKLIPALREHPHVGWLLVRSAEHGPVALGASGAHYLADGRVEGEDPLAPFSPTAPRHLLRTDGFAHVADIMVGSFYDPELDEGCAFEELISFHGGLGGPQTRPFILHPARLPLPASRSSARPPCTACSRAGGACFRAELSQTAPPTEPAGEVGKQPNPEEDPAQRCGARHPSCRVARRSDRASASPGPLPKRSQFSLPLATNALVIARSPPPTATGRRAS